MSESKTGRELTVMSPPDPAILAAVDVPAWCDPRHIAVAWALSDGFSRSDAAKAGGVSRRTVYDWLENAEFVGLVQRLTPLTGLAQSSARVSLAKELLRKLVGEGVARALSRTDAVGVMRFIREEVGARGLGGGHGGHQVFNQFFLSPTTLNMGQAAVAGEVVDVEAIDIIEDSSGE